MFQKERQGVFHHIITSSRSTYPQLPPKIKRAFVRSVLDRIEGPEEMALFFPHRR